MVGSRLGGYQVELLLGVGGMGEVYRAHDTRLNREVALKVLPPLVSDDADRLARFKREAQVRASLNHPHIGAICGLEALVDICCSSAFAALPDISNPDVAPIVAEEEHHLVAGDDRRGGADQRRHDCLRQRQHFEFV